MKSVKPFTLVPDATWWFAVKGLLRPPACWELGAPSPFHPDPVFHPSYPQLFTERSSEFHEHRPASEPTMNQKSRFSSVAVATLPLFSVAFLMTPWQVVAQSPPSKTATTWQDLGFDQLPEGFSIDVIPLFEGLNEARGSWSFEGETTDGEATTSRAGSLQIEGNPKSGMISIWRIIWAWPADDPDHSIVHRIMVSPGKSGFELMLVQVGPLKNPGAGQLKPGIRPAMFVGTWNLENRTVTWTEGGLPARLSDQAAEEDSSKPKQQFEMVVAVDGKISIQNSKHAPSGQMASSKAISRTDNAPAEPVTLTGTYRFKTADEVLDQRIKPWLPPQATEISLLSERGGHCARYKVEEDHFMKFLDGLWEVDKGSSAHKRDEMSGEGEPGNPESIAKRLKTAGQEPLDNFRVYYSPSKQSSAMTTYFYDRKTGVAYQDRGCW